MQPGDTVMFRGPMSESNGHFDQPAIVTKMWGDGIVNVKVFPDTGNNVYDACSVLVVEDEAAADAHVKEQTDAGNPYWKAVCWSRSAKAA